MRVSLDKKSHKVSTRSYSYPEYLEGHQGLCCQALKMSLLARTSFVTDGKTYCAPEISCLAQI